MARTHRNHLSEADYAKKGGHNSARVREGQPEPKPHKQRRANERAKMRKEHQ